MSWKTALAVYVLIWVISAFVVLPFSARTSDEAGLPKVQGQADSAPARFEAGKIVARTTIVATVVFALIAANFEYGWLTVDMVDYTAR